MDIMMRLKGAGFSVIANEFRQREKRLGTGLPLQDFVEIVLQGLPKAKTPEEKYANVNALVDLFEDMDINGDGTMEFDEFTSYCVDAGMVATRNETPTLKHRYVRSSKHVIKTMNGAVGIEKVKWSPFFKQFLVVENAAKSVKLFNAEGKMVADIRAQSALINMAPRVGVGDVSPRGAENDEERERRHGGSDRRGSRRSEADNTDATSGAGAATSSSAAASANAGIFILDAVFLFKFQCLAMSTTDFVISFYNMEEPKHHQRLPGHAVTSTMRTGPSYGVVPKLTITTTNAQLMLRFCDEAGLLFSAGNDFVVNVWKISDLETKTLWKRLIHHQDMIMDIIEIPAHDLIASCDMNHTIQLWDIRDCRSRGALLGHARGIKHMVFSKDHDMLLTAGFEFDAYGWDLASRQVVMKLVGHRAPLIGIQLALFQSERAVTGDSTGVFKVWDISRATGVGSHGAGGGGRQVGGRGASHAVLLESLDPSQQLSRFEPTAFVCLHPLSRDIWTAASGSATLHLFRSTRVQQFDEIPLRAFYHYNANRFVVVCGPVCSLWDGETGVCIGEFTHVGSSISLKKNPATGPEGTTGSSSHNGTENTHGTESTTDILLCTQDSRCKKLVVLSEEGEMGVFNCQNFVQMRRCEEAFKTQPIRWSKTSENVMPSASCGIVGLHYCSENKIIIATDAHTSSIVVIDDANSDSANGIKETRVLRRLIHIPGGIASSAYSYHASMIAVLDEDTNTKISLWDFETLSFLGTCQLDDDDQDPSTSFTTMEFWDEYPVLVVADQHGGVYFFAVMPTKQASTGRLLHVFINDHSLPGGKTIPEGCKNEDPEESSSAQSTNGTFITEAAESAALQFLRKRTSLQKAASRRTDRGLGMGTQEPPTAVMNSRGSVTCMRFVCDDNDHQMQFLLFTGDERGVVRVWDLSQMMRRLSLFKIPETKCKYLRRGYHPRAMFSRDCTKETISKRDGDISRDISGSIVMSSSAFDTLGDIRFPPNQAQLKKLTKQRADAKKKSTVATSGSALAQLLAPNRVQPGHAPPSASTVAVAEAFLTTSTSSLRRQTKIPNRKESIVKNKEGGNTAAMINIRAKPAENHRRSVCLQNQDVTIVTIWYAHSDGITSLEVSKNPNIVVTCSLDTRVFVWTWQGMCHGKLYDAENAARSKWRFHKDDSRREEERRSLVNELLHELEMPPQQKAQRRRQTLYQDHVQRKSQKELPHVSVMLVDHIVSQHPEIAAMEQDGLSSSSTDAKINAEMEKMRQRNYNAKLSMLQMIESSSPESTHPKDLARIHSLAQVGPLLCVDKFEIKDELEQMKFIEKEEVKMDRQYLEDELSITARAGVDPRKASIKTGNMDTIRSQIREAQRHATEMMENKVALQRHSMAMYLNLRQVQARYSISTKNPHQSVEALLLTKQTGIPLLSTDKAKQKEDIDELLEPSPFLRSKLPDSVLSTSRPQTAPSSQGNVTMKRSASSHGLGESFGNDMHRSGAARTKLRPLTASASETALIKPQTIVGHRTSSLTGPSGVNRRSSLDLLYVEEARRQARSSFNRCKSEMDGKDDVMEEPESIPGMKKLDLINDIIDRAQAVGVVSKTVGGEDNDVRSVSGQEDFGVTASRRQSQRGRLSSRSIPANLPALREADDATSGETTPINKRTDETTLRAHLEHTRRRMELAMRDSEHLLGNGGSQRSQLHKKRLAVQQMKKEKRMDDYLQQKRRELNTNIGAVFKRTSFAFPSAGFDDDKATTKVKPGLTSTRHHRSILEVQAQVEKSKVFGIYGVKEVMSIIRLFSSMDEDGSGVLTLPELLAYKGYFEKLGYHDMATVFQAIDKDGSGSITLKELLEICFQYATKYQIEEMLKLAKLGDVASYFDATRKRRGHSATRRDDKSRDTNGAGSGQGKPHQELSPEDRAELRAIFHVFDRDGDGGVSMEEIIEALHVEEDEVMARVVAAEEADLAKRDAACGSPKRRPSVSVTVSPPKTDSNKSSAFTKAEIQKLYQDFDTDGNRSLDFEEFVSLMRTIYGPRTG